MVITFKKSVVTPVLPDGSEFDAYVISVTKASDAITSSKKHLEQVALGGTAVGTGANTPKGYRKKVILELFWISL